MKYTFSVALSIIIVDDREMAKYCKMIDGLFYSKRGILHVYGSYKP
jgi:hypothetical protein